MVIFTISGIAACGGGGGNTGGGNNIPPRTTTTQILLHSAESEGNVYIKRFIEKPIVNAPPNTDFNRWAIEEVLGSSKSIYVFKKRTSNIIRHFKYDFNSESYVYKRDYRITGAPTDSKFGKFGASRGTQLYLQSQSDPAKFYYFTYNSGNELYEYANSSVKLAGIPADADLNRWGVTTDALGFVYLYTFKEGSNSVVYQFNADLFHPNTLSFTDIQTISGIPTTVDFSDFGTAGVLFSMNFLETKTTDIICGRESERLCTSSERTPSCDAGLVEDSRAELCVKP